jgi:1-deoxy-D-xylulose-5-phosphate synthase
MAARNVRRGDGSLCLLAVGKMVAAAEDAAVLLADVGVETTVWDVRVVSPPDPAMLADAAGHQLVLTVEDGVRHGGAGMFLADAMETHAFRSDGSRTGSLPPVRFLGVPRTFLPQAKPDRLLAHLGLDGPGIAASALALLRDGSSVVSPETL